jgi:hypothetical protein
MEMPAGRRTAVLVIILASYFMIVLDISIVITALPKIHYSLGFSATELSWVQNAYTLAFSPRPARAPRRNLAHGQRGNAGPRTRRGADRSARQGLRSP